MLVHAIERTVRRGLVAVPLACALLCACDTVPTILPPPFGPNTNSPQAPRLFFPTGLAVAPSGQLLVANANFDQAFSAGTVVSLDPSYLNSFFTNAESSSSVAPPPVDIPRAAFLGAAMIGNYAGPLTIDQTGLRAFTGSRDTGTLNALTLDPATGALSCSGGTGSSDVDCRSGFMNTASRFNLLGPYAIVPGVSRLPGATTDVPVLFVSTLIPYIDTVISSTLYTSAPLAALRVSDPTQPLWVGNASSDLIAGGIGAGPMIFDAQRRKLVLGGCYTRFGGQNVGAPSSGKCTTTTSANLIRFVGVDEGPNPGVQVVDIASSISSNDTEDLALGNNDPTSGLAQTLYAVTRTPDLLVEIGLPSDPTQTVQVTRATSMPIAPSQMIRLARPSDQPGPDLIAVTLESSRSVAIYDASAGQVVGQIENLGVSPFAIAQFPAHPGDTTARLAVSVFEECRVALIDVNFARPWEVRLRGRLGSCPIAPP